MEFRREGEPSSVAYRYLNLSVMKDSPKDGVNQKRWDELEEATAERLTNTNFLSRDSQDAYKSSVLLAEVVRHIKPPKDSPVATVRIYKIRIHSQSILMRTRSVTQVYYLPVVRRLRS
jgi:hypothetical protein